MSSSSSSSVSAATASVTAVAAFAIGGLVVGAWAKKKKEDKSSPSCAKDLFPATSWPEGKPLETRPEDYPTYDYEKDPLGSFVKVGDMLIDEIVAELPLLYDLPDRETNWIRDMLEYNVKGGKMNRGLMVVESGVEIYNKMQGKTTAMDNVALCKLAVLGWAIEWLQAWLLVADDIMDSSVTRRGQPCWYKKLGDSLWYVAINDAVTIESMVYKMLKRHFATEPCYVQLLDLMMETTFQTELGQLSDTLCDVLGLEDLTPERWNLIVTYKTSFYSFYLSVAFAMVFAGHVTDKAAFDAARDILVTMGVYFQAQDDYLDCYATPEQLGKVGTDIADKKCGWLFTKAYHQLANDEQRAFLNKHYGKCKVGSPEEAKIKELYTELGLKELYAEYERASYDKIMKLKESAGVTLEQAGVPWQVIEKFLQKVYKRSK